MSKWRQYRKNANSFSPSLSLSRFLALSRKATERQSDAFCALTSFYLNPFCTDTHGTQHKLFDISLHSSFRHRVMLIWKLFKHTHTHACTHTPKICWYVWERKHSASSAFANRWNSTMPFVSPTKPSALKCLRLANVNVDSLLLFHILLHSSLIWNVVIHSIRFARFTMPVVHHLILKYLIYYKQLRLGFVSVAICSFGVQVYHFISLKVIYYLYTTKATASCLFSHLLCSSYLHEYTTLIHTDHLCPPAPIKMKKKNRNWNLFCGQTIRKSMRQNVIQPPNDKTAYINSNDCWIRCYERR